MKILLFAVLVWITVAACGETSEAGVSLTGYNYTDEYISDFTVDAYSGANITPQGGGGSYVCCISIPRRWRPGLVVTVRWTKDYRDPTSWRTQLVSVPQYKPEEIGFFAAHFYRNDVVKVHVTKYANEYPGYPYPKPTSTR